MFTIQRWSLMLALILISLSKVISQDYAITHYSVHDGLPSNEVYSVTQDIQGYIWISTDKGISRFDGSNFIPYGITDGLSSSGFYKIIPSPLGGIVFHGSINVGAIRNDSIYSYSNYTNDHLASIYGSKTGIAVCFKNKNVIEIYDWKGNKLEERKFPDDCRVIENESFGLLPLMLPNARVIKPLFQDKKGNTIPLDTYLRNRDHHLIVGESNDFKILASANELAILDNDDKVSNIRLSASCTGDGSCIDSKKQIWIGLFKKGVEVFNSQSKELIFHLLDGKSISSIYEDAEQNIWLSTLDDGLFKLSLSTYQLISKEKVKQIVEFNDDIVTILNDSSLLFYNSNSFKRKNIHCKINSLLAINDTLFVGIDKKLKSEKIFGGNIEFLFHPHMKIANYRNYPIGIIYKKILKKKGGKPESHNIIGINPGYTYATQTYKDTIYTGRTSGLYKVYEDNNQFVSKKLFSFPVTSMNFTEDGYFFGTKGHGIIHTSKEFSVLNKYTIADGLAGNFISAIKRKGDSLFCGTNKGISLITNAFDSSSIKIYSSSTSQGLLSKNVLDLVLRKQELFVLTDKGIQTIKIAEIESKRSNPKPIIERINGKKIGLITKHIIPAGKASISIELNNIFFDDNKEYVSEYRLLGNDSNWTSTSSTELEFLNLSPGEYELQYRTKLPENQQYSLATLNFELMPLFVQKKVFKILLGIISLLLTTFIFYLRDKYIQNKNKILLTNERLRYQALTAQLNPHFMFNALGSIQHFIITKQNDLAAENLASFSGLLNKALKNTNDFFIPLADEMAFIDEYVEVEKTRFEKPFLFQWIISNEISPNYVLVPTMFLQPYIENSILHGINPQKKQGKIDVSIEFKNDKVLIIIIKDNGIGLKASRIIKKGRESMALVNIRNRISAMEKIYKKTFHQQIKELEDKGGSIVGTEVIIEIPYKIK